jgi:hypothetical protein
VFATIHTRLYAALVASFCVLGLCLTFAQPVFSLPDEPAHWLTANVRLERFLGTKGCVPTVLGHPCPRDRHLCSTIPALHLSCAEDIGVYGDLFTYPGVVLSKLLLPRQTESAIRQVQAIVLSRLLSGLLILLCLARVGVLARRTGRLGSLTLAALMLSPLLAQQAFAVSSDGAQLALGVCLFSALMFWDALTRFDVLLFLALGYSATAKPSMLPLILPTVVSAHWLAEIARPGAGGLRTTSMSLLRALKPSRAPSPQTLLLWSALLLSALTVLFALYQDAEGQAAATVEDSAGRVAHLQELREHPLRILDLVDRLRYDPRKAAHWVGPLGWLDLWVAPAILNAFLRILWLSAAFELARIAWLSFSKPELRGGSGRRLGLALPGFLVGALGPIVNVLFMTALMYVLWTPLGAHGARGVQLRYFFPASMVTIALLFRLLGVALPVRELEGEPALRRLERWLPVLAPCLVLALSLPYVSRLFVDLSVRYHDPAKYPAD